MAASMPCSDCSSGTLHGGTPVGKVINLHGLPAYVTEPPSGKPKGIIVIIPDAFGWKLPNTRVLADSYAKKGEYRVYVPEFMDGHWLPHDLLGSMNKMMGEDQGMLSKILPGVRTAYQFAPFLFFNRLSVTKPRIWGFFKALREDEAANLPVGAAGFCWGGKITTLLCHDTEKASNGKSLIDAGFTAHPSMLALPGDVEAVRKPLGIAIGTKDFQLPMAGVEQVKAIFEKKEQGKFELRVYEGAKHGFAVRGNPAVEKELKQGIEAEDQAVSWFRRWLG